MAISIPDLSSFKKLATFAATFFPQLSPETSEPKLEILIHSDPAQTVLQPSRFSSCPINGPASCHSSTDAPDTCCYISPGGLLLQTQFWDSDPAIGPDDSWTLHGLWPDNCDGTYEQYCHAAPRYHNITSIFEEAEEFELLDYMLTYWLPNRGSPEHFWQHEWNKHGTCINTLSPDCYGDDYVAGQEVIDFMARAVEIFRGLDTFEALAFAGIVPSWTRTYSYYEIEAALIELTGYRAVLGCSGGRLNQAWYYYNVKGSMQSGEFMPTEPLGWKGSCPRSGIRYLPKV